MDPCYPRLHCGDEGQQCLEQGDRGSMTWSCAYFICWLVMKANWLRSLLGPQDWSSLVAVNMPTYGHSLTIFLSHGRRAAPCSVSFSSGKEMFWNVMWLKLQKANKEVYMEWWLSALEQYLCVDIIIELSISHCNSLKEKCKDFALLWREHCMRIFFWQFGWTVWYSLFLFHFVGCWLIELILEHGQVPSCVALGQSSAQNSDPHSSPLAN